MLFFQNLYGLSSCLHFVQTFFIPCLCLPLPFNIFIYHSDEQDDVLSRPASIEDVEANDSEDDLSSPSGHDLKGENVTYYQSLIDQRDCPYIVSIQISYFVNVIYEIRFVTLLGCFFSKIIQ